MRTIRVPVLRVGWVCVVLLAGCGEQRQPEIRSLGSSGDSGSTSSVSSVVATSTTEVTPSSSAPPSTVADEPVETAVSWTPTSTPSAKRLADGTVISAGGYTARTPSVANGMLLEPAWSVEQQPIVDMIHKYIDAWYLAQAEPRPTGKPSQEMLDLENPRTDLNADPIRTGRILEIVKEHNRRATWKPGDEDSYFALTSVRRGNNGILGFSACERNALVMIGIDSGEVEDDAIATVRWEIVTPVEGEHPSILAAIHSGGQSGDGACSAR